jgi:plastocyanin
VLKNNSEEGLDMRRISRVLVLSVSAVALIATVAVAGSRVAVLDECDPATFNATPPVGPGLGTICDENFNGDVTFAEFLSLLPPGHPAWRNEPSWLAVKSGKKVKVKNEGGEDHTFTEVAEFGGGYVPELNEPLGLTPVPECAGGPANPAVASSFLEPGASVQVAGLDEGTHLFQCCIHPWMRAAIKVEEKRE